MSRVAKIVRQTAETQIELALDLDGTGQTKIATGVGFLDHMLTLLAGHALFDLTVTANGDLHIDDHHTVEDIGICLGDAVRQAVGDKKGIARYGHMTLPMDETLVTTAVDLSGRAAFVWQVTLPAAKVGTFDTELAEEFWAGATRAAAMNCHVLLHHGRNTHHIIEAIFKALGRSLRMAVTLDPRRADQVPSTKGVL